MDAQVVGVATAVFSAAVAALGLLLTWYRREDRKEDGKVSSKNRWLFVGAGAGIAVLAAAGIVFTFLLGSKENSRASTESTRAIQLTEAQYRRQVSAVCSEGKEKALRIQQSGRIEDSLGPEVSIEQDEVRQIKALQPPDTLKSAHEDLIPLWERRISLLDSAYNRASQLTLDELMTELAAPDRLGERMNKLFKSLGVPECIM
ncbi:MAG: hypothetical protein M3328_14795 [Chloroflexota bacterium]|nr:hypothetical protein [Chloroflexota bacterium]